MTTLWNLLTTGHLFAPWTWSMGQAWAMVYPALFVQFVALLAVRVMVQFTNFSLQKLAASTMLAISMLWAPTALFVYSGKKAVADDASVFTALFCAIVIAAIVIALFWALTTAITNALDRYLHKHYSYT